MVAGSPIKEVTQQFAPKAHLQGKPAKIQYDWHMLAVALAVKLYPDTWQEQLLQLLQLLQEQLRILQKAAD